jgi:hypothetical protein
MPLWHDWCLRHGQEQAPGDRVRVPGHSRRSRIERIRRDISPGENSQNIFWRVLCIESTVLGGKNYRLDSECVTSCHERCRGVVIRLRFATNHHGADDSKSLNSKGPLPFACRSPRDKKEDAADRAVSLDGLHLADSIGVVGLSLERNRMLDLGGVSSIHRRARFAECGNYGGSLERRRFG